jgi:CPA1 family monovalent cation:H+ antiporter
MDLVVFGVSALTVALAIMALAVPAARRVGLPLPVAIAGAGLLAGTGALIADFSLSGTSLGALDRLFVEQVAFDSSALLHIFLPPLLFEMALSVNVRRLLDDIGGVIVMAVVAVVAATLLVGAAVWSVTPFALTACLMLGAAVATTDPGAVITTFREIGAPKRLMVILEGESLLNDAAAIAIFTFLLAMSAPGADPGVTGVLLGFLYSFGVGAACGLGLAFLASRLYPVLGRSAAAEVSMTMAVAYGAYLVAEQVAGASGVVAVVFAGLMTGSSGFIRMGPGNWNTVQTVWTQTGFWANALILMLVSLMTPWMLSNLHWTEAVLVLFVYAGAFAARALILFVVMPLLEKLGRSTPMARPQRILAFWGGVRGAVTLVLALSLTQSEALGETGPVLGALAAAFTLMTLFINASTLGLLTARLGLDQLSPADLALRERIVAGAIERVRSVIHDIASARTLEPEALAAVEEALGRQKAEVEAHSKTQAEDIRIPFGERLRLGLAIICGQEARLIRRGFEEGAIGPRVTSQMRLFAERISDAARTGGRDSYAIAAEASVQEASGFRLAILTQRYLRWDRPLRELIAVRLTALLETDRVVRGLQRFADATLAPMVGADAAKNLGELLALRLKQVHDEIDTIDLQYPAYVEALERTMIARAALRRERHQYERLHNDGVIGSELRDSLIRDLDVRERVAAMPPRLDLALSPADLLDGVPLFRELNERQRKLVLRRLRTRFTVPGEVVLEKGTRGTEMYFVASGALEACGKGAPVPISNGDFFGELALILPFRRRKTDVISKGFSRLLVLRRREFIRLKDRDPSIEALIRRAAEFQLGRTLDSVRDTRT